MPKYGRTEIRNLAKVIESGRFCDHRGGFTIDSDRFCADGSRPDNEKRPVSDAFLVAAGTRQRSGAGQRRPFSPGRQGFLLHFDAIVVGDFRTVHQPVHCSTDGGIGRRCNHLVIGASAGC